MATSMIRAFLLTLALLAVVVALAKADKPKLKARVDATVVTVMNLTRQKLSDEMEVELLESTTERENLDALLAGDIDFLVTALPARSQGLNTKLMHFPIATGGISIVSSAAVGKTISMSVDLLAGLFSGRITRWNDPAFLAHTRALERETAPVNVVLWDVDRMETKELRRYLKFNSGGKFNDDVPFAPTAKIVGTWQEALEELKKTPGSITYAPYGFTPGLMAFQMWLELAGEYVAPFPPKFKNSLMPFKREDDLPLAEDSWESFTLTDMTKMPPDGSCMSMPPYGLSRFFYIITKQDHRSNGPLKGAAIGAFIRVASSLPLLNHNLVAPIPPPAVTANARAISRMQYRDGETPQMFLRSVPIDEPVPEQMTGPGMTNMAAANLTSVYITIAFLLSSGLLCVGGYYLVLKYYKAEVNSWVPHVLMPLQRGQPKNYQPLQNVAASEQ